MPPKRHIFSRLFRPLPCWPQRLARYLWPQACSPLFSILKERIRKEGPLTVEQYMDMALQDPRFGYYRHGDPLGSKDFCTAPEVSQLYDEMVALWVIDTWHHLGKPDPFILLELGPGHGTLLDDVLNFTKPMDEFARAVRVRLLESNATLRAAQQERLAGFGAVHIETLEQLEPLPLIFVANEFFDNLSVRQFVKTAEGWAETLVGLRFGRLALMHSEKVVPLPPDPLADKELENRPLGWVHEMSLHGRNIMARLASHIARHRGAGLIADYGYGDSPGKGTLDAWSHSCPADILECPGRTDITADVDFGALAREAAANGVLMERLVGQGAFLLGQGIDSRAEALKETVSEDARIKIDNMLDCLITQMGTIWKVMTIGG